MIKLKIQCTENQMKNLSSYIIEKLHISDYKENNEAKKHLFEYLNNFKDYVVLFPDSKLQEDYHIEDFSISISNDKKYISLDKIIIKDKNEGYGTKFMYDLCEWCDKNNKILTLTPSDAFGGNIKKLNKFYKKFGFIDNKGRKSDFNTRQKLYRPLK